MLLIKLKQATWEHKCDWSYSCRKWVKYWYKPKNWYYCKKHAKKFEHRNRYYKVKEKKPSIPSKAEKKAWKRSKYNPSVKRKVVVQRVLDLREKATWSEKIFNDKMKIACPVRYQFQRAFIKGGYFAITDFYVPSRHLCIEIDGEYHQDSKQAQKDKHRDNWLRNVRKLKVHRLTNAQAKNITVMQLRQLLDRYLRTN